MNGYYIYDNFWLVKYIAIRDNTSSYCRLLFTGTRDIDYNCTTSQLKKLTLQNLLYAFNRNGSYKNYFLSDQKQFVNDALKQIINELKN